MLFRRPGKVLTLRRLLHFDGASSANTVVPSSSASKAEVDGSLKRTPQKGNKKAPQGFFILFSYGASVTGASVSGTVTLSPGTASKTTV